MFIASHRELSRILCLGEEEGGENDDYSKALAELWGQCNPVELLLHLKVRLAEATRPSRALRLLDISRQLLNLMGAAALEPAALHLSIHLALW